MAYIGRDMINNFTNVNRILVPHYALRPCPIPPVGVVQSYPVPIIHIDKLPWRARLDEPSSKLQFIGFTRCGIPGDLAQIHGACDKLSH